MTQRQVGQAVTVAISFNKVNKRVWLNKPNAKTKTPKKASPSSEVSTVQFPKLGRGIRELSSVVRLYW